MVSFGDLSIHAAADGIAMGAAFFEEASGIGWVVFFHKAPSSFGLATFLLAKRYSKVHMMKQIGSAAAPISAIVTFFLLGLWDYEDSNLLKYRTGLILLFSAGMIDYNRYKGKEFNTLSLSIL
jgi:zinc transporter 9